MDDLSTEELRRAAAAANLRRAFGAPVEGNVPAIFTHLLRRLSEVDSARGADGRHSARQEA